MDEEKDIVQNEYSKAYSEKSLFKKIMGSAQKAGISVVYAGLILFYTLQKTTTPGWAKGTIIATLGYFISPIDAIPDLTPVAGYADDFGAIILALAAVAMFIDEDSKKKARKKLKDWFGNYDESQLSEVDNKIDQKKE